MRAALAVLVSLSAAAHAEPAADVIASLPRPTLVRALWLTDSVDRLVATSAVGSYETRRAAIDMTRRAGPLGLQLTGELVDATGWSGQRASLAIDATAGAHALRLAAGVVRAEADPAEGPLMEPDMTLLTRAEGEQCLLGAYLQDIVRPSHSLEVGGAIGFDWWEALGHQHFAQPVADEMATTRAPLLYPSARAGVRQHLGALTVGATGFVDTPATDALRPRQHLDPARLTGIELAASWHPADQWLASAAYTPVSRVAPPLVGLALAGDAHQLAAATVTYDAPAFATITAQVRYVDTNLEHDLDLLVTNAHALVDGLIGRHLGAGVSGYVIVENLMNRRPDGAVPPRLVMVGLKFDSARP